MPNYLNIKIFTLAILLLLFTVIRSTAQGKNTAVIGECTKLRVNNFPENNYLWKVYSDSILKNEVTSFDVEFLEGNIGAEVLVRWNRLGVYYFIVKSSSKYGCINLKVGKIEVITSTIKANAGSDVTIGSCQKLTLDGSASKGNIISYEWSPIESDEVIIENANSKIAKFSLTSNYKGVLPARFQIKLRVADKLGRFDCDTTTIEIDKKPIAKIDIIKNLGNNKQKILDGTGSFGTKIEFNWYTSDGIIIVDNNKSSIIVKVPGRYGLLIKDNYGCEASAVVEVPDWQNVLIANSDFGRCSWADDLVIKVLDNDYSSDNSIIVESVMITEKPLRGNVFVQQDGTVKYSPRQNSSGRDKFEYMIFNACNLCDSAEVIVDVIDAPIVESLGFSPNGDGINDFYTVKGLEKYPGSKLYVFSKNGQLIFENENYLNDWDGKTSRKGSKDRYFIQSGTYYYILQLGGTNRIIKGFIYIAY
jgi:gliding motility-associated-like protein